jgi:DNA-binding CsgD family transcriptional regulator
MPIQQLHMRDFEYRIVGAGRDPETVAAALLQGASVVVAGSFGSGKTHLLQSTARVLERSGRAPLRLHPGRHSARRPFASLDAASDPRAADLRSRTQGARDEPVIALVDDAHLLDVETTVAIAEAAHARSVAALLCVEVPRAGRVADFGPSASIIIDLSLRGAVDRLDLTEMTATDAQALLELFPGTDRLDTVTRSRIVVSADGSRRLLRELAAAAATAAGGGRDPLTALHRAPQHAGLGHAVATHLAHLHKDDRHALAIIGLLPRLAYADATRLLDRRAVDHLISVGLVSDDRTVHRRLVANRCLSREAARDLEPGERGRTLHAAAARMLSADGAWWSVPIACMIAEEWHGGRDGAPTPESVTAAMRARVMRDAARRSNDAGAPALAIAYTSDADPADQAIALERIYAGTLLGSATAREALATIDPVALEDALLRRYLRMRAPAVARRSLTVTVPAWKALSEQTAAELTVAEAETAALDLQWDVAIAAVEPLLRRPPLRPVISLRAALVAAMSAINLGSWARARTFLDQAHQLTSGTERVATIPVQERLLAIAVELLVCELAGMPAPTLRARLNQETLAAAREGELAAIVFAGFCNAMAYAIVGDVALAAQEARAAADRSASLPLGPYVPLLELQVAEFVALAGFPDAARKLILRAGSTEESPRIVAHRRAVAELTALAAEGHTGQALGLTREALAISSTSPALRLRDLSRIVALGGVDDPVVSAVREAATTMDLPLAPLVASRVEAIAKRSRGFVRRDPLELLRLASPWAEGGLGLLPGNISSTIGGSPLGAPAIVDSVPQPSSRQPLTPREQEIAHHVADGLSNRKIAERLYLSVRTVESHVYQARAKLGARSRAEFGRALARLSATEQPLGGTATTTGSSRRPPSTSDVHQMSCGRGQR